MNDHGPRFGKYPHLEALLEEKGLSLKGTHSNRDVANIFIVSVRTIQEWVRNNKIRARDLPGRARFLSEDLEELLVNSRPRTKAMLVEASRKAGQSLSSFLVCAGLEKASVVLKGNLKKRIPRDEWEQYV
jgi:transposase